MRDLVWRHRGVTHVTVIVLVAIKDIKRIYSLIHPALVFFPNTVIDEVVEVVGLKVLELGSRR